MTIKPAPFALALALAVAACALLSAGVSPALGSAPDETGEVRVGDVSFKMPAGWKRKDEAAGDADIVMTLVPDPAPQDGFIEIRIAAERDAEGDGSARSELDKELAPFKTQYQELQATPITANRHLNGFDMAYGGISMRSDENPQEFLYELVFVATPNPGKVRAFYAVTNRLPLYNKAGKILQNFFNGLRFTSRIVLADGDPPLTQHKSDEAIDFLEWLLDVPMTQGQKQVVQDFLVRCWREHDEKEMTGLSDVLQAKAQLAKMDDQQKGLAREVMRKEAIQIWRKEQAAGDPMAKVMVDIYDAAHQPIADGDPPLTRQAADATIEVLFFMACQVEGGAPISPVSGIKDEWAKRLAQAYGAMEPAARQEVADMPMRWAALRYAWPGLPEGKRKELKDQWAQGKEVQEIAAAITKLRQQTAAASAGNSDKSAAQLMDEMQRNNRNFTMLSNISMQMHQARMSVAYNMGGGWRYNYRR